MIFFSDYNYGEWHLNKDTGHRERQVTYKTVSQSILGTNSLLCREKQVCFFCENSFQLFDFFI